MAKREILRAIFTCQTNTDGTDSDNSPYFRVFSEQRDHSVRILERSRLPSHKEHTTMRITHMGRVYEVHTEADLLALCARLKERKAA